MTELCRPLEIAGEVEGTDIPIQVPQIWIDYTVKKMLGQWIATRSYMGETNCSISHQHCKTEDEAREQTEKWRKADNRAETCDPMRSYESMPDYA